jgi:hypothetical protein
MQAGVSLTKRPAEGKKPPTPGDVLRARCALYNCGPDALTESLSKVGARPS